MKAAIIKEMSSSEIRERIDNEKNMLQKPKFGRIARIFINLVNNGGAPPLFTKIRPICLYL